MASKYAVSNSRSPMMFSKFRKGKKRGEKEQQLSRSLDDLLHKNEVSQGDEIPSDVEWPELASVKKVSPVVMCILPSFSMDFVCSALLSVGATPLITDNVLDVVKDLRNCKAVVVDVSAPPNLINALIGCFDPTMDTCLVLAATQVGCNDRKKDLAVELIERCGPSLVTGRLADIYALGQVAAERDTADSDTDDDDPAMKPQISVDGSPDLSRKVPTPAGDRASPDISRKMPAPSRIHQGIKAKLSAKTMTDGDLSPHISPHVSPRASPCGSPQSSPRHSLGSSPVPGGVKNRWKVGRKIQRMRTYHPRIKMKGQFQDNSMMEVNVNDALLYGQKLAAHTRACIYLFETSILTDGETDIEIQNPQPGTRDLHSLLPCSAAIAAACVSSVQAETEDIEEVQFHQFSHAMALWCAAIEEAGNHANQKGHILPGAMRSALIDALHYLNEPQVRSMARLFQHNTGSTTPTDDN